MILTIIFWISLSFIVILIALGVYELINPNFRFWPPPSKNSWQFYLFWILWILHIIGVALIAIIDYDNWIISSIQLKIIGLFFAIVCIIFELWGVHVNTMQASLGLESELHTKPPYTITRNPQYLGFIGCFIGCILFFNSIYLTILLIIEIIFFLFAPLLEEPWLEQKYGESYLEYKNRVRRWLGKRSQ